MTVNFIDTPYLTAICITIDPEAYDENGRMLATSRMVMEKEVYTSGVNL